MACGFTRALDTRLVLTGDGQGPKGQGVEHVSPAGLHPLTSRDCSASFSSPLQPAPLQHPS